jgi:putative endonuclease
VRPRSGSREGSEGARARERAQKAASAGRCAEELAARYLEGLGWTILGRNVRVSRLELDIVARDGGVVIVVEVRTRGRGAWERPLDSVDARKRMRVRRAGEALWRSRFKLDPTLERMRFDLIAVDLEREGGPAIEHLRAAL